MALKKTKAELEASRTRMRENNRKLLQVAKKAQAELDRRHQQAEQ